ncbi:MAG: hypothetical protein DRJ37_01215 [Thermoprotei archaeon]|nr:MAG: hypothetical protein DRJ37_01215 [Thermoprotei archaeon]
MYDVHRRRIEACTYIWSILLKGKFKRREQVVAFLEKVYKEYDIEPIRGKTKIEIFDKEMATLYLVGKYGLGLNPDDYGEIFNNIFTVELRSEEAAISILSGADPEKVIREKMGEVNENLIFRVIRLVFTASLLGFRDEKDLVKLLEKLEERFPQYGKRFLRFKKFYIAFRIAEGVAMGKIRNRLEKEALKHALCIKLNATRAAPSDSLVREIAVNVLKADEIEVNDALKIDKIELSL